MRPCGESKYKITKEKGQKYAPCEDRTHDLQISELDYETDALPTALTRHLLGKIRNLAIVSDSRGKLGLHGRNFRQPLLHKLYGRSRVILNAALIVAPVSK